MNGTQGMETARLREELAKLLTTLKNNRENVSLDILKTKYKKAYDSLCSNIRRKASSYAAGIALGGIRIHKDYLEEAVSIVNETIRRSGILKQLSKAAFSHQDMAEFESLAGLLREKILAELESFYTRHLALYITQECMDNPEVPPLLYCVATHCFWQDGKWIPLELYRKNNAHPQEKAHDN